jgi:lysophospholipase L1-like esterase
MRKDIRIAFVGDSFVNGTGDQEHLGWTGRVCQILQTQHPDIKLTAYNLGIRRETSTDIRRRWQSEVSLRLVDAEATIVIFCFGVNDCVEIGSKVRVDLHTSAENLHAILMTAKTHYDHVLFVMPPPVDDEQISSRTKALIRAYTDVCNKLSIAFIDCFDALSENTIWQQEVRANDGAHPRMAGYALFAKLIALQPVIPQRIIQKTKRSDNMSIT